jgi:CBS domain-containing protein
MKVGEVIQQRLVTVSPTDTLADTAKRLTDRNVGCAVVPTDEGPGIITERDLLRAIASGVDPNVAIVNDHMTSRAVVATPEWDIEAAARSMLEGGFRHLVVVDRNGELGVLSIRDLMAGMLEAHPAATS